MGLFWGMKKGIYGVTVGVKGTYAFWRTAPRRGGKSVDPNLPTSLISEEGQPIRRCQTLLRGKGDSISFYPGPVDRPGKVPANGEGMPPVLSPSEDYGARRGYAAEKPLALSLTPKIRRLPGLA